MEESFKDKWNKADKKVIAALIVGGVIGAIFVKATVKVEIHAAADKGYAQGMADMVKSIVNHDVHVEQF